MELLNSKVDHQDYMGDHTAWGAELVKRVGFVQIGPFHTGGVPGRHELDETRELQWAAITRAIADLGYQGYAGQELIPTAGRDPLASLRHGVRVCTV